MALCVDMYVLMDVYVPSTLVAAFLIIIITIDMTA